MKIDRIIDGYNLLPYSPAGRQRYGPGQLERARLRLLKWVATRLTEQERRCTTVVFDGREAPGNGLRTHLFRAMQVIYSAIGQEADDVIEHLIARHPHPEKLVIVSSDARLRRAIQRRRGTPQESPEFINLLESRSPENDLSEDLAIPEKPDQELSTAELEEWLSAFQNVTLQPPEPAPPRVASPLPPPAATNPVRPARVVEPQPLLAELEMQAPGENNQPQSQRSKEASELDELKIQSPVPEKQAGMQSLDELEAALEQILREEGVKAPKQKRD